MSYLQPPPAYQTRYFYPSTGNRYVADAPPPIMANFDYNNPSFYNYNDDSNKIIIDYYRNGFLDSAVSINLHQVMEFKLDASDVLNLSPNSQLDYTDDDIQKICKDFVYKINCVAKNVASKYKNKNVEFLSQRVFVNECIVRMKGMFLGYDLKFNLITRYEDNEIFVFVEMAFSIVVDDRVFRCVGLFYPKLSHTNTIIKERIIINDTLINNNNIIDKLEIHINSGRSESGDKDLKCLMNAIQNYDALDADGFFKAFNVWVDNTSKPIQNCQKLLSPSEKIPPPSMSAFMISSTQSTSIIATSVPTMVANPVLFPSSTGSSVCMTSIGSISPMTSKYSRDDLILLLSKPIPNPPPPIPMPPSRQNEASPVTGVLPSPPPKKAISPIMEKSSLMINVNPPNTSAIPIPTKTNKTTTLTIRVPSNIDTKPSNPVEPVSVQKTENVLMTTDDKKDIKPSRRTIGSRRRSNKNSVSSNSDDEKKDSGIDTNSPIASEQNQEIVKSENDNKANVAQKVSTDKIVTDVSSPPSSVSTEKISYVDKLLKGIKPKTITEAVVSEPKRDVDAKKSDVLDFKANNARMTDRNYGKPMSVPTKFNMAITNRY